jgi:hypothetical protein
LIVFVIRAGNFTCQEGDKPGRKNYYNFTDSEKYSEKPGPKRRLTLTSNINVKVIAIAAHRVSTKIVNQHHRDQKHEIQPGQEDDQQQIPNFDVKSRSSGIVKNHVNAEMLYHQGTKQ